MELWFKLDATIITLAIGTMMFGVLTNFLRTTIIGAIVFGGGLIALALMGIWSI